MTRAVIDFETFIDVDESGGWVDLRQVSSRRYASSGQAGIFCLGYQTEDEPPQLWKPGDPDPDDLLEVITGGGLIVAHNAGFEKAIWTYVCCPTYNWPEIPASQWSCTMARGQRLGLPGGLDAMLTACGHELSKDKEGGAIMKKLCKPKKTRRGYELPTPKPGELEKLYAYCLQDVAVQTWLDRQLPELPPGERDVWLLDQRINERGVGVDAEAVATLVPQIEQLGDWANSQTEALTGIWSIKSPKIREWVNDQAPELELSSLDKVAVSGALLKADLPPDVRQVLELRRDFNKGSVAKFAQLEQDQADGRVYSLLAYHAAHTGRWGGRRFQPQNLPRPTLSPPAIELAFAVGDLEVAGELLGRAPVHVASDMLRGVLIAKPDHKLVRCDFAGIEARVTAWVAGEESQLEAFRSGRDLYVEMAADVFDISPAEVTGAQRQVGKAAILGLGFGMGWRRFSAELEKLPAVTHEGEELLDFADDIVRAYRDKYPAVNSYRSLLAFGAQKILFRDDRPTFDLRSSYEECLEYLPDGNVARYTSPSCQNLLWLRYGDDLALELPSGRDLFYPNCELGRDLIKWYDRREKEEKEITVPSVSYWPCLANGTRLRQVLAAHQLIENAVQAIARDLMVEALLEIERRGWPIVFHVHDEAVVEVPESLDIVGEIEAVMSDYLMAEIPWAAGLPIKAEAQEGRRYAK